MIKQNFRAWVILVIVSGVLWWGDGRGWFNWLKRPLAVISQPVRGRIYRAKSENAAGLIDGENERIEKLSVNVGLLEAKVLKLSSENEALRKLMGTKLPPDWQFVPANILELFKDKLRIDVGMDLGVSLGDEVLALTENREINGGILVGRVNWVSAVEAEVRLVSHLESKIKVKTSGGAKGVVIGSSQGILLDEVLQKYALNQGELIVSLGTDGVKPDLVIGRVGEIVKEDRAVFQTAGVVEILTVAGLNMVMVVK